jgi:hypothetical protein
MFSRYRLSILPVLLALTIQPATLGAQKAPKPDVKPDFANEAFVIEQNSVSLTFENDGTGTRESSARIRIQSDAGVQHYSLLLFSYQNSTESIDIDHVRVHKPDGSVIDTPAENSQDMAAEITRTAPFYSDLREKHITVKGLSSYWDTLGAACWCIWALAIR